MTPSEALGRVEAEIRQVQAEALGSVGERLDRLLDELARHDRALHRRRPGLDPGSAGHRQLMADVEARNRLRDEAAGLVWALIVQREAIGVVHHAAVRERYPVPPRYRIDPELRLAP